MDFVAVCTAVLLWFVRPQDWLPGMGGFGFMTYAMLIGMIGLWRREGGLEFKNFKQSPADWLVVAYLGWIVWTTGSWVETAKAMIPFGAFYYVSALALNTSRKLYRFVGCWVWGLTGVAILAASTIYGFELAPGSDDLTESFGGRLALNTWIYNNPNSLGHGAASIIPVAYLWFVWRRSGQSRLIGLGIIWLAAQVVYETESKGAYLSCAAACTVCFMFRKPKVVQIFIVAVLLTLGLGAIKLLPRMENLSSKEEGIMGRLMIWQMAYNAMENTRTGEGWKKFEAWIETPDYGLIRKATHGSYVNVGADLGYVGLFLFVGILYANGRTLYQAQPLQDDEVMERCQRVLLSLTASFSASAWMIDRAYHTDYFMLAGATAAFHRLMTCHPKQLSGEAAQDMASDALDGVQGSQIGDANPGDTLVSAKQQIHSDHENEENTAAGTTVDYSRFSLADSAEELQSLIPDDHEGPVPGLRWRRLGIVDLVLMILLLVAVIYTWQRMMTSFISI